MGLTPSSEFMVGHHDGSQTQRIMRPSAAVAARTAIASNNSLPVAHRTKRFFGPDLDLGLGSRRAWDEHAHPRDGNDREDHKENDDDSHALPPPTHSRHHKPRKTMPRHHQRQRHLPPV